MSDTSQCLNTLLFSLCTFGPYDMTCSSRCCLCVGDTKQINFQVIRKYEPPEHSTRKSQTKSQTAFWLANGVYCLRTVSAFHRVSRSQVLHPPPHAAPYTTHTLHTTAPFFFEKQTKKPGKASLASCVHALSTTELQDAPANPPSTEKNCPLCFSYPAARHPRSPALELSTLRHERARRLPSTS